MILQVSPLSSLCLVLALAAGCASSPPGAGQAACLKFRSSGELNDSTSITLILVGVTNPDAFQSASHRELLSDNPPGTEGRSSTIVVTPGEAGTETAMIDPLSKRLGVIADYRNRTTKSQIAVDLPIRCHWPTPSIDLMRDTIDD